MKVYPNHSKLQYSGRIDWSNRKEPVFVFPCTSVRMRFTGRELKVRIRNRNACWDNFLGCILDGRQKKFKLSENGESVLDILTREDGGPCEGNVHEVLLFKRQDACHELTVLGFELEDGAQLLDVMDKPKRRIEVYGDSVSAGEVSEATAYTGKPDPEHRGEYSNSWYSYAWMTARKLNAEIHDIAQGGIALLDGTGWFHAPDHIGMESAWNKIHYDPVFGEPSIWDFKQYDPQVVIVAIGQNDSHPTDYMKEDYDGDRALRWRSVYGILLGNIRKKYPKAHIICITTLLEHDASWDKAIGEVCRGMQDKKISHYLFKRNGCGTPGHLRIAEAEEMAEELSAYIESLQIEGWDDK